MPVSIACPKCKTKYRLPDSALGKPVKCQKCGASFRTSAPPQTTGNPAPSQQLSTKKSQPQTAVSKVLQPSQQEISKMGIQGAIKKQADIFSAPPPPTRSNPLGNFSIEDPGFADLEVAKQEVEEEVRSDGMESILGNPYASGTEKKLKGGFKRKSQAPAVDLRPYSTVRTAIKLLLIGWIAQLIGVSIAFLGGLGILFAMSSGFEGLGLAGTVVLGLVSLPISLCTIAGFIGSILLVFTPSKDERLFAGLSIGAYTASFILSSTASLMDGGPSPGEVDVADNAIGGAMSFAISSLPVLVGLGYPIFQLMFFRRMGKNIKSKAVVNSTKFAMVCWILTFANTFSIFTFLLAVGIFNDDTIWGLFYIALVGGSVTVVLALLLLGSLIKMGFTSLKHMEVV